VHLGTLRHAESKPKPFLQASPDGPRRTLHNRHRLAATAQEQTSVDTGRL